MKSRVLVSDTADLIESTVVATRLLMLFFYVGTSHCSAACLVIQLFILIAHIAVTGIAMLLSFFVLWISFTSNVSENSWEFGVLRAIGLNVHCSYY